MTARKRIVDTLDKDSIVDRFEAILRSVDRKTFHAGRRWYPRARHFADTSVAAWCGLHYRHGAGIVAALSPQASWERNCEQAEAFALGEPVRNTSSRLDKASLIAEGHEPEFVLSGPKERAFYGSILDPVGHRRACIDRHMVKAAGLATTDVEIRLWLGRAGVYDLLADCVAEVADRTGLSVPAVQAIIWVAVR